MRCNFREYGPSDRNACIEIFRTNVPRYFGDPELKDFLKFIDSSGCPYFVVLTDNRVVGCGGYGIRTGSDSADLCWGMIDASRHGYRIGESLLFARLSMIVSETDASSIRLSTSQLTSGFFLRYGFSQTSQTIDGIAEGLDDVQMRIDLTEHTRDLIERCWKELRRSSC